MLGFVLLVEMRGVVGASARCNSERACLHKRMSASPVPGFKWAVLPTTPEVSPALQTKEKTDLFVRFVLLVEMRGVEPRS